MEFDLRLMRLGYHQPWGFFLRGGLDRPLVVDRVIPKTPAHGHLQIGDQVLDIEGHLDTEINSDEAESLIALKRNYLRLGILRLPMFSNQYMGTRLSSRSLPRTTSSVSYNNPKFYTPGIRQPPVNSTNFAADDEEQVDYSFMQLPVRERRKLFLGHDDGRAPKLYPAGAKAMTLPRLRMASHPPSVRHEVASEYGGGDRMSEWEQQMVSSWSAGLKSAPNLDSQIKSSSGVIKLSTPQTPQHSSQIFGSPFRAFATNRPEFTTPSSVYSTTIQLQNPYDKYAETRILPNVQNAVFQSTYRAPTSSIPRVINEYGRDYSHGRRVSQPLRVNVYNSDGTAVQLSPISKAESTWGVSSPIYPAYPANVYVPRRNEASSSAGRYRRGQSVQPVTLYTRPAPPMYQRTESQHYFKPLQADRVIVREIAQPRSRFVSSNKPVLSQHARQEPTGVSDF